MTSLRSKLALVKGNEKIIVFSTHFEDRFFGEHDDDFLLANSFSRSAEETMLSAKTTIAYILNLPLSVIVISLHPINFMKRQYDGFALMLHIKNLCEERGFLVTTFKEVMEQMEKPTNGA